MQELKDFVEEHAFLPRLWYPKEPRQACEGASGQWGLHCLKRLQVEISWPNSKVTFFATPQNNVACGNPSDAPENVVVCINFLSICSTALRQPMDSSRLGLLCFRHVVVVVVLLLLLLFLLLAIIYYFSCSSCSSSFCCSCSSCFRRSCSCSGGGGGCGGRGSCAGCRRCDCGWGSLLLSVTRRVKMHWLARCSVLV